MSALNLCTVCDRYQTKRELADCEYCGSPDVIVEPDPFPDDEEI